MARDYAGIKCGLLTFIRTTTIKRNGTFKWELSCECGGTRVARPADVLAGKTQSCGCYQRKAASLANLVHGKSKTTQYRSWKSMLSRCGNPNVPSYAGYGAKGITVCPDWLDYGVFLADMGERPKGMVLDRIDNTRGYSKDNCRWTTVQENNRNKCSNRTITINGQSKILVRWIEDLGIKLATFKQRRHRGLSIEQCLTPGRLNLKQQANS